MNVFRHCPIWSKIFLLGNKMVWAKSIGYPVHCRMSKFEGFDAWDFEPSISPIFNNTVSTLVTGSDDSEWYQMTGKSASPLLLLPSWLSAQSALPCIKWDWLLSCLIDWHSSSNMRSVWCFRKCVYFIQNKIVVFLRLFCIFASVIC